MEILNNSSNARAMEVERLVGKDEYSPILIYKVKSAGMDCYDEVQQYFRYRVEQDDVSQEQLEALLDVIVSIFKNNPEMRMTPEAYNNSLLNEHGIDIDLVRNEMNLEGRNYEREYLNENIIAKYVSKDTPRFEARAKTGISTFGKMKTITFENREVKVLNKGKVERTIPIDDIREVQYAKKGPNRVMVILTGKEKIFFSKGDENLKELTDEIARNINHVKVKSDRRNEIFSKYGGELKEGWVFYGEYLIQEFRKGITLKNESNLDKALVAIYPNRIEIFNRTYFTKKNVGSRVIFFKNVTSIDLDIAGRFEMQSGVQIHMISGEQINILFPHEANIRNLYNNILNVYNASLEEVPTKTTESVADELGKIADLYTKGLLSEEEFAAMKRKIIE